MHPVMTAVLHEAEREHHTEETAMKIAMFKCMEFGYESPYTDALENFDGHVRISEYVDVDFPPLKDEEVVRQQLDQLDALAKEETEKYRRKIAGIDERKSKLMSITHQPEAR